MAAHPEFGGHSICGVGPAEGPGTQADARLEPMTPLAQEFHGDAQSLDSRRIRPSVALSQLRGASRGIATSLSAATLTGFLTRWRWQARPRSDSS